MESTRNVIGCNVVEPATGLRGRVRARAEYESGQVDLLVQPKGVQSDGSRLKATWVNEKYLREDMSR